MYYYMFMTLGTVRWECRDFGEHVVLDCPLHTIAFILGRPVIHCADWPVILKYWCTMANNMAACMHCTFSARRVQKVSIHKRDRHTYTYIQTQNEMWSRISCLALRRSVITLMAIFEGGPLGSPIKDSTTGISDQTYNSWAEDPHISYVYNKHTK